MNSKILILGARSNLSKRLYKNINNSILISSIDLLSNDKYLELYSKQKLYIIINSFYPASKLNSFSEPLKYTQETDSIILFLTIPKTSKRVEDILQNINILIPRYSEIIKKQALNNVNIINTDHLFKKDYNKYISEGIHYSSLGHKLVYEEILKILEK